MRSALGRSSVRVAFVDVEEGGAVYGDRFVQPGPQRRHVPHLELSRPRNSHGLGLHGLGLHCPEISLSGTRGLHPRVWNCTARSRLGTRERLRVAARSAALPVRTAGRDRRRSRRIPRSANRANRSSAYQFSRCVRSTTARWAGSRYAKDRSAAASRHRLKVPCSPTGASPMPIAHSRPSACPAAAATGGTACQNRWAFRHRSRARVMAAMRCAGSECPAGLVSWLKRFLPRPSASGRGRSQHGSPALVAAGRPAPRDRMRAFEVREVPGCRPHHK